MKPLVGVLMGSRSDWSVLEAASATLESFGVPHEVKVLSAHRTPDAVLEYAQSAEERGLEVLIAAAGLAAALPGVVASKTLLPVLGVPVAVEPLRGVDALLAMVQMPAGVPVGTLAIGRNGAVNAALLATSILSATRPEYRQKLAEYRRRQSERVLAAPDPRHAT